MGCRDLGVTICDIWVGPRAGIQGSPNVLLLIGAEGGDFYKNPYIIPLAPKNTLHEVELKASEFRV